MPNGDTRSENGGPNSIITPVDPLPPSTTSLSEESLLTFGNRTNSSNLTNYNQSVGDPSTSRDTVPGGVG